MTHSDEAERMRADEVQTDEVRADAVRADAVRAARGEVAAAVAEPKRGPGEVGGREGPDPTRFGDWELRGRCIDF
jgi:hypothetical protein